MDVSWLGAIDNPIGAFVVLAALFIGAVYLLNKQAAGHNAKMVDKFIDKADSTSERMMDVIDRNTKASTEAAVLSRSQTAAMYNLADTVKGCEVRPENVHKSADKVESN